MSSSWNVQANGKKVRAGNRSDAIIIPSPVINYVRPNLTFGNDEYAGPADIWNPGEGFLVQSINPNSYNLNFPTTGAHNLYFDLLITGDIEELTWAPVTHEGITATVTNVVPNYSWISGKAVARVKLTGPEARSQWKNPSPSQIAKPGLPQTFELVGRDINTGDEVVKYGFVLKKWFISSGAVRRYYNEQSGWCRGLGYRIPRVRDLTNSNYNNLGAAPSSSDNNYMRHIGAGFFTEWGDMHVYPPDAGFVYGYYWTGDATGSSQFNVYSYLGGVHSDSASNSRYGLCTAP
ncbi:hypothetical protein [Gilliamella sp. Gris3-2]|uniref:hypothetical protein n=1 Tax=Gilliamella sp. Gris3-2 TaxID=3120245 RepID=UPI00080EB989|nr:hypothetical protein [Gilliamella apicola]OCG36341.1 hypothetical protein A9G32_05690 [Gilliamella apicola]OCG52679.1 hypothetical protein A9G26_01310 [Gilliamella apicola]OCG54344.1 hypothetical protein A9G27_07040 [Gilliamella apicola]